MSAKLKQLLGIGSVVVLSITAWVITCAHHMVTIYNDAMSHLDIPRLVVDNIQPGIAQLGSVWLPLNHILSLPLIWNRWAWHSGFAGSFVSMLAYIFATICTYKLVRELSERKVAALLGAAAFALNPNLLYLQSTPLTEPLFLALMVSSILYLVRYLKFHDPKYLVLTAVLSALQMLTRYDGWFLVGVEALVVAVAELGAYKQSIKKTVGIMALLLTPSIAAALLWLLWNLLIFGNALYSFTGPYSAHAQQATIQASSGLITKGSLSMSSKAFLLDVVLNIGIMVAIAGVLGWVLYLIRTKSTPFLFRLLVVVLLVADVIFNVIALFIGFSILNIPAMHWDPTHTLAGEYFNVRYGITALPFVSVGFGLLASKLKPYIAPFVICIVVLQFGLLVSDGLITIKDGTVGSSAFVNQDIASAIKKDVGKHDEVIMSSSSFNGVMFESGLNLKQYIHEGVNTEWKAAIASPTKYARWIVMANGNVGDPVYSSLMVKEKGAFLRTYKMVYAGKHADPYERRAPFDQYVTTHADQLNVNDATFEIKGVNSYDLAYQSNAQIAATFKSLKQAHVNTIRFWLFGDGTPTGFQPQAGILNGSMLKKSDYILLQASKYQIRVIPTLVNNFTDYGGADQYVAWAGLGSKDHDQFFTNTAVVKLYENYWNHILARRNGYTKLQYRNDPTILAWDIMNEPRTDSGSVQPIATWSNTIAKYIKSNDQNHLVTISLDKPTADAGERSICASAYIDFCSVHIYPQDPKIASYPTYDDELQALRTYKKTADTIHKPVVITEIGVSKTAKPFGEQPLSVLGNSLRAVDRDEYSGWLIWDWSEQPDTSYGFSPKGTNGTYSQTDLSVLLNTRIAP